MKEPCYLCKEEEAVHLRIGRPGDLHMNYDGKNVKNGEGIPFGYCTNCWHTWLDWGKHEIEITYEEFILHQVMRS